jgi:hypothetical protein
MLQSQLDHDIRFNGTAAIPDFQRISISFPFVDRLGDGYTSMCYGDTIIISASNAVAVAGAGVYGYAVTPGVFDPDCEAYSSAGSTYGNSIFSVKAYPILNDILSQKPAFSTKFAKNADTVWSIEV